MALQRLGGEGALRVAIFVLALAGIGISCYLTIVEFMGETPACVAGSKGCATVASSPYSHLLGVPVSVWGLVGYALLGASALVRGDGGRVGGFVVALTGTGFSAYLTYLELFVIDAVCQWCVASAIVMTVALGASLMRLLVPDQLEPAAA